ncbi:hypothetical protein [Microbacterium sp. XT11]|uniref:hypothetical protein n=1 Tax=Microbacterium sp. XT11 TaxID=367477 RepID=UPI00082C7F79|nr:hypothetical protein [Microbacterium sp. XT11]
MARPKSPCGTYPAYQRHLREKTPVDPACRRAQQEHDAKRSGEWRRRDITPQREASPVALPVSRLRELRRQDAEHKVRFARWVSELSEALADDDVYTVIDRVVDLDRALQRWIDIRDEIHYREGWPYLEDDELRGKLMAWGREYFDGETADQADDSDA